MQFRTCRATKCAEKCQFRKSAPVLQHSSEKPKIISIKAQLEMEKALVLKSRPGCSHIWITDTRLRMCKSSYETSLLSCKCASRSKSRRPDSAAARSLLSVQIYNILEESSKNKKSVYEKHAFRMSLFNHLFRPIFMLFSMFVITLGNVRWALCEFYKLAINCRLFIWRANEQRTSPRDGWLPSWCAEVGPSIPPRGKQVQS